MEEFFFQSILLKIPIFPQGTKHALVFGFLAPGRKQVRGKNGIGDQLDFTLLLLLSQVWPTQQLWWMSHLQEYITNSKTVPALNSKVSSLLQCCWETIADNGTLLSSSPSFTGQLQQNNAFLQYLDNSQPICSLFKHLKRSEYFWSTMQNRKNK